MKQLYEYLLGKNTVKKTRSFDNASLDSLYNNVKSFSTCKDDKTIEHMFDNFEFLNKKHKFDKLIDYINMLINNYVKDGDASLEISTSDGRSDRSNIRRYDFIIKFGLKKIQISFWERWGIFGVQFIQKYKTRHTISFEKTKTICGLKSTAYWYWTETIDDKNIEIASSVIDIWIRANK